MNISDIAYLRKTVRHRRRQLNRFQLKRAEIMTTHRLLKSTEIRQTRHIAVYLNAFGEIPTHYLCLALLKRHKHIYLPKICTMNQQLQWQKITIQHLRTRRWAPHRLGFRQWVKSRAYLTAQLDCMIMPLVLFDTYGHRVGMGGGFYDRTLAQYPIYPRRIGLAHDFQYIDDILPVQAWDQNLDAVCTPHKMYRFKRH